MRISAAEAERLSKPSRNRKAPPRAERDVVRAILAYLRTRPDVTAWRCNSGMAMMRRGKTEQFMPVRFGVPGMSDIIGWKTVVAGCDYNGCVEERFPRFLAIEAKREGQRPSPTQSAFLDQVRRAGGLAVVATKVQDVIDALEGRT